MTEMSLSYLWYFELVSVKVNKPV